MVDSLYVDVSLRSVIYQSGNPYLMILPPTRGDEIMVVELINPSPCKIEAVLIKTIFFSFVGFDQNNMPAILF